MTRRPPRKRADGQSMCIRARCRKARHEEQLCVEHFALKLWADAVKARDKHCRLLPNGYGVTCLGRLEADHLISRSYHATRFILENGITLCLAHHKYVTEHPLEHAELAQVVLGEHYYDSLRRIARTHLAEDPLHAIERLRPAA